MSSNSCKKPHQMISYKFQVLFSFKFVAKTIFLTRGFDIFCSCHWLYLGTVDSFLSVSDTRTQKLLSSCHINGKFLRGICCLIIKSFLVKISQNLSLDFWLNPFREPRTFPGTQFCLDLQRYYILAPSVSNFSPVNALILSILIILPVRLIMWEVLWP